MRLRNLEDDEFYEININEDKLKVCKNSLFSLNNNFTKLVNSLSNHGIEESYIKSSLNEVYNSIDTLKNDLNSFYDVTKGMIEILQRINDELPFLEDDFADQGYKDIFVESSESGFSYVIDPLVLLSMFADDKLRLLNAKSLSDIYDVDGISGSGKAIIDSAIDKLLDKYSGREAVVNLGLFLLYLGAKEGYKMDYAHDGTRASGSKKLPMKDDDAYSLTTGLDCNAFVSYLFSRVLNEKFTWGSVNEFGKIGLEMIDENTGEVLRVVLDVIPIDEAQPGDIFVVEDPNGYGENRYNHVGIIIMNDVQNNNLIIMEAKSKKYGIVMSKVSYKDMKVFEIRDVSKLFEYFS